MSHWVHVAAIVRLDALRALHDDASFLNDVKEHFGKSTKDYPFDWDDQEKVEAYCNAINESFEHPDEWLPAGSEGTCEMQVYEEPDPCSMSAYTVSIYGDLRDVDTGEHIIEWFKGKLSNEALENKRFWVRQAVITVEEEASGNTLLWAWGEGEQE